MPRVRNVTDRVIKLVLCLSALLFGFSPSSAAAQSRAETLQAIAKLKGSERETKLREGARKEGNLIWYSSTTAEDSLALNRKFQELYPFVKVQHLRAPSEKMIERILLESRAGHLQSRSHRPAGDRTYGADPKEIAIETCRSRTRGVSRQRQRPGRLLDGNLYHRLGARL